MLDSLAADYKLTSLISTNISKLQKSGVKKKHILI